MSLVDKFVVIYGSAIAILAILLAETIIVTVILWGWFITPLFGIPVPSWPEVGGLSLLIGWLKGGRSWKEDKEDEKQDFKKMLFDLSVRPVFVLVISRIFAGMLVTA